MLENKKQKNFEKKIHCNIFVVSTIEKRLQELHRKLSEIAEIPKILSSTLATVSQTFDKLTNTSLANQTQPPTLDGQCEQKRKMSYDEDIYDYELSDDSEAFKPSDDDEEECNVKRAYLQLKRYAARQRKSKDVTPESDYASESNYQTNESNDLANDAIDNNENNDDDDNDDDDDDDEKSCDMYEEFTLSLFNKSLAHHNDHESESDTDEYDVENDDKPDDDDDDDNAVADDSDDDDDDFLTTTFTWNLPNQSKLQRNDSPALNNSHNSDDNYEHIDDNANKSNHNVQQHSYLGEGNILKQIQDIKGNTPDNDQKVDKLERSWPWADREKIIYKQSTCHLVPHKPLGLIEQRIQLLAKRNLLEHLNKTKNPQ